MDTPDLVNLVPALAYHFCLPLPTAFTQPGARLSSEPYSEAINLVVSDDGVELAEGGEAEKGVDYVGRQVDRGLPLFSEIGGNI